MATSIVTSGSIMQFPLRCFWIIWTDHRLSRKGWTQLFVRHREWPLLPIHVEFYNGRLFVTRLSSEFALEVYKMKHSSSPSHLASVFIIILHQDKCTHLFQLLNSQFIQQQSAPMRSLRGSHILQDTVLPRVLRPLNVTVELLEYAQETNQLHYLPASARCVRFVLQPWASYRF